MAEKKPVSAEAEEPAVIDDGKVDFYAFKDTNKYKDDIFVGVNGKAYKIQRGKHTRIPKAVAEILENSMEQDARTAELIEREGKSADELERALRY